MSEGKHVIKTDGANQAPGQPVQAKELACALVDGEVEHDEVARAIEQCEGRDWMAYQLIGDVLRQQSEGLRPVSVTFATRMSAALEREAAHVPSARRAPEVRPEPSRTSAGWRRWFALPALAFGAAVASVVWVAQPLFEDPAAGPIVAQAAPVIENQDLAFRDYMEAHRQLAGPIVIQTASYVPGAGQ